MPRNPNKTFCKRCFSHKLLGEMVSNKSYGPGYKYLCKSCDRVDIRKRKLGIVQDPISDSTSSIKYCHKCSTIKDTEDMYFNKSTGKYTNSCKNCRLLGQRKWKGENRERVNESGRKSSVKNSEKLKEKRVFNKDKKAEYDKAHRKNRKRDFKKEREDDKKRRNEDPFHHTKFYLRRRMKKAFRMAGYTKVSKSEQIIGLKWEELITYFLNLQGINILDREYMKNKHVDHICPLSQAVNEEELIKLCHYSNLQILAAAENIRKSDRKTPEGEKMCLKLLGRAWI